MFTDSLHNFTDLQLYWNSYYKNSDFKFVI